jgi:hypothetical protein
MGNRVGTWNPKVTLRMTWTVPAFMTFLFATPSDLVSVDVANNGGRNGPVS